MASVSAGEAKSPNEMVVVAAASDEDIVRITKILVGTKAVQTNFLEKKLTSMDKKCSCCRMLKGKVASYEINDETVRHHHDPKTILYLSKVIVEDK